MESVPPSTFARQLNTRACRELYRHVSVESKDAPAADQQQQQAGRSHSLDSRESINSTAMPEEVAALDRYSQLLQLLPCLRWFRQSVLVELFFSGLIGSLSIESVMPFILNMDVELIFSGQSTAAAMDLKKGPLKGEEHP